LLVSSAGVWERQHIVSLSTLNIRHARWLFELPEREVKLSSILQDVPVVRLSVHDTAQELPAAVVLNHESRNRTLAAGRIFRRPQIRFG
jgi:hypothetical protein